MTRIRRFDSPADIDRQNNQKARAMARMAIYDALTRQSRDFYKIKPLPRDPSPDEICEVVENAGAVVIGGRLVIPSENSRDKEHR